MTVESLASGPAIAAAALARMTGQVSTPLETIRGPLDHPNRQQVRKRLADVKDAEQEFIFRARPTMPGEFHVMPARAFAMYDPDRQGSSEEEASQGRALEPGKRPVRRGLEAGGVV